MSSTHTDASPQLELGSPAGRQETVPLHLWAHQWCGITSIDPSHRHGSRRRIDDIVPEGFVCITTMGESSKKRSASMAEDSDDLDALASAPSVKKTKSAASAAPPAGKDDDGNSYWEV